MKPTIVAVFQRVTPYLPFAAVAFGGLVFVQARVIGTTGGHVGGLIDDVYIHFRYAEQFARGHGFAYSDGSGYTKGFTSLLYPLMLAPGALVTHGEGLMYWALAIALAAQTLMLAVLWRLARAWGLGAAGAFAAACVAVPGVLQSLFYSGMEVAPAAAAVALWLYALDRFAHGDDRGTAAAARPLALVSFAVPLLRPELLPAALFAAAYIAFTAVRPRLGGGAVRRDLVAQAALAAAGQPLFSAMHLVFSGDPAGNSMLAKSLVNDPNLTARQGLEAAVTGLRDYTWNLLTGTLNPFVYRVGDEGYHPVGTLALAALGAAALLRLRPVTALGAITAVAAGFFVSHLTFSVWWGWYRYCAPFWPLLYLLAGVPGALAAAAPGRLGRAGRVVAVLTALWFVGALVRQVPFYHRETAQGVLNVHEQQRAMGEYIHAHLPAEAVIGLNDAGAIAYFSRRRVFDAVGLVTNDMARCYRSGLGCMHDTLRAVQPAARPTHFAVYIDWLHIPGLFAERIHETHARTRMMLGGTTKALWTLDWARFAAPRPPRAHPADDRSHRLVDELDVAAVPHERAHGYRIIAPDGTVNPPHRVVDGRRGIAGAPPGPDGAPVPVMEGGRVIERDHAEVFALAAEAGRDLVLVMRTDAWFGLEAEVQPDDKPPLTWKAPASREAWSEPELVIPGAYITRNAVRLRITCRNVDDFASWHYWAYVRNDTRSEP